MNMGMSAILSLPNKVDVIVVSRHIEPFDPGCFRSMGIEPSERRYLMLKSRVHYRVGFREMAKAVVECAGCGVCTSDYSQLEFNQVRQMKITTSLSCSIAPEPRRSASVGRLSWRCSTLRESWEMASKGTFSSRASSLRVREM